jgi:membrane associated rhomboid family serine protease
MRAWIAPAGIAVLLAAVFVTERVLLGGDDRVLAAWLGGARIPVLAGAQPWRVVTAAFVHLDARHLLVNAVGVLLLGGAVARVAGPLRTWTGFVATAIAASALGLVHPAWSVGASGGVFGLLGIALGHALRAPSERRRLLGAALPWVAFLAVTPFLGGPALDHAAHLGGLAAGLLLGLAWTRPRFERVAGLLATLIVAAAFGLQADFARRQQEPPTAWERTAGLEVPPGGSAGPSPDPRICAASWTDGVLFLCAGRDPDDLDAAGFTPDDPAPADPAPSAAWPEVRAFRPATEARAGQRLVVLRGPERRVLVVHELTTALPPRSAAILRHVAAN